MKTHLIIFLFASLLAAAAFGARVNPFPGHTLYVNPSYQQELATSIATATGAVKTTLQSMSTIGSAYWLDVKRKIHGNTTDTMEGILMDALKTKSMVTFIIYDLPNRDCAAVASNGEICCYKNADGTCNWEQMGDCAEGINEYKTTYIDPAVEVLAQYQNLVPITLIIEPDSLPNLATNLNKPHCGNPSTQAAYTQGVTYAVQQIAAHAPAVTMYIDAAHGGWLGWADNMNKFISTIVSLNVIDKIRGFSTNVANYQPLGVACPALKGADGQPYCLSQRSDACCEDPCGLINQYNFGNNELNYIQYLHEAILTQVPSASVHFVTDTGRNGVPGARSSCSNWCNIRGAGVGHKPVTEPTAVPLNSLVDALLWLKTPGESDGCTQQLPSSDNPFQPAGACPRYDTMCGSSDSLGSQTGEPFAPEAGHWFDYQIKQLAANAHL